MNNKSEFFFFLTQDHGKSSVEISKRPTNLRSVPYIYIYIYIMLDFANIYPKDTQ